MNVTVRHAMPAPTYVQGILANRKWTCNGLKTVLHDTCAKYQEDKLHGPE